jgi:hypothetical protein
MSARIASLCRLCQYAETCLLKELTRKMGRNLLMEEFLIPGVDCPRSAPSEVMVTLRHKGMAVQIDNRLIKIAMLAQGDLLIYANIPSLRLLDDLAMLVISKGFTVRNSSREERWKSLKESWVIVENVSVSLVKSVLQTLRRLGPLFVHPVNAEDIRRRIENAQATRGLVDDKQSPREGGNSKEISDGAPQGI